MLPNFLVIGAEKSGTTWLHKLLRSHPDIYLPATKEIHFFNELDSNLKVLDAFKQRGVGWYEQFFIEHQGKARVGEVTPMYLCDELACSRIHATLPDAKLVVMLRHPVDRAYAHYWMAMSKGHESRPFDDVIAGRDARIIERGLYGAQLERFLATFPKENIKVLIFEEVVTSPKDALRELASWLDLAPEHFPDQEFDQAANPSSRFASPALSRLGPRLARMMKSNPLTFHLHKACKDTGLIDWIKTRNRREWQYVPLDQATWLDLAQYYQQDVAHLESQLGHEIHSWHKIERDRRANVDADHTPIAD